ncbi:MAG: 4-hydroxy-tetrahydrodipicolinate synthase [Geminicoccaceae bacterium]|nr:4-hydroxy-tetrahydrodipicolinate synthase [Geminicoccaceae bacterium]MCS7266874.1 4-hydroxy-tetrahydrodipicolinate synthase [Geminicoccaceae bacterium]MCX7628862.1 4-hydroxy-tetrahydrodipicolinate synthase [Geminicoccaceae bacterium]MDW8124203.1 4-hydroxy-tetrahydrodipicolinate synthase [Geminicoccaceae bacterium]MDW8340574.1 4-hydroxy-tetrahydrodipicolinate synthase [Geminicoccaceae bacterium]
MFRGSIVALVTPFRNGAIDERAFQDLVEWHLDQGTDGFVPVGTTGESPTLSHAEHQRVIELCVEAVAGRAPVIAGTGSNSTEEAISLTRHAKKVGADAALVVTPYYNKPTQEGLYQHFKAIHDAVDLPIIIYNIPGRCVVDMTPETMARLARLPNIVGVKDATNDIVRPLLTAETCGPEFCQLSGEDANVVAFLAHGGHGCISVTANVAPALCAALHDAWAAGRHAEALAIHRKLMPLHRALFCETNPGPVKYALSRLGRIAPEIRLPLVMPSEANRARIEEALAAVGIAV